MPKGIKAGQKLWARHPHVRTESELTLGERAADVMRSGFGSWTFVFSFCVFLGAWMALNSLVIPHMEHGKGFDPYPYILLNLCLSCLAALQGAFILIAQKRADRIAAEQALSHYADTKKIDQLLAENTQMTTRIDGNTALVAKIYRTLQEKGGGDGECQRDTGSAS